MYNILHHGVKIFKSFTIRFSIMLAQNTDTTGLRRNICSTTHWIMLKM